MQLSWWWQLWKIITPWIEQKPLIVLKFAWQENKHWYWKILLYSIEILILTKYFSTFCIDIDNAVHFRYWYKLFFLVSVKSLIMIVTYFREIDRKVETVHIDQLFEQLIQIPNLRNILLKFSQHSAVETLLFTFPHFQYIWSNR